MIELEWLEIVVISTFSIIIAGILFFLKRGQIKKIERRLEQKEKETALRVEWECKQDMANQVYREFFWKTTGSYEEDGIQIWKEVSLKRTGQSSFYDIFALDGDRLCFVIGEIEGRDMEMLLELAAFKSMIRSQMQEKKSPKSVMETINRQWITRNSEKEIRLLLINFNKNTNCMMYCNAGYTLPILKKGNYKFETISMEIGEPVGGRNAKNYWQDYQYLHQGDSVLLYSAQVSELVTRSQGKSQGKSQEAAVLSLRETLEYENSKVPIANMGMVIKELLQEKTVADENTIIIVITLNQD